MERRHDAGKRKGEEGGSLLSVFLETFWDMAQQETAGASPALQGGFLRPTLNVPTRESVLLVGFEEDPF